MLDKPKINRVKATLKQRRAIEIAGENGGIISKAMIEAGYSEKTAHNPDKLTKSQAWEDLMEKHLPDKSLTKVHKQLLKSTLVEHKVFPLAMEDKEIKDLLKSVNCTVRKIQRGDQAVHVWFWAANDRARKDALDMAYKLKGRYKDKPLVDNSKHYHYTNLNDAAIIKLMESEGLPLPEAVLGRLKSENLLKK